MKLTILLKILHTLAQMRQREYWPRRKLLAYQTDMLRSQRQYAYAFSPFYQQFHKGLMDRPLSDLPVLTKATMMEHFDDLVTDRTLNLQEVRAHATQDNINARLHRRYWVTATSGSSGHPGFFVYDEAEWIQLVASFARGQEWSGSKINLLQCQRMATVASMSAWHVSSQVANTAKSWWRPSIRIAASDPLLDIVDRLNEWQPDILISYASMARILANEQIAGRLDIHPDVVFTSSEVLTEETRRRVNEAWRREPFNEYGTTETANIAAECAEGRHLHVYEDMLILEVVDEQNHPIPHGEYGAKVLVTTFFSRTQPLIRYEINDSVRLVDETCPSGRTFTVLDNIQGRMEDILYLPSRQGGRIAVQPLVFNRVMDIAPVGSWQLIQEADDSLTLLLSGPQADSAERPLIDALTSALSDYHVAVPVIRLQRVDSIPKTSAGKSPLIRAYHPDPIRETSPA